MALRMHLFPPKPPHQPPKFLTSPFPSTITQFTTNRPQTLKPHCSKKKNIIGDAELASDLSKMNTLFAQRDEAMNKSRELLFAELCKHLDSEPEEVKKKWRKMDEDDKWVLVRGFVSDWGANFHPLSVKSVRELVEEFLLEENPPEKSSSGSDFFPGLKRMMGFSEDK